MSFPPVSVKSLCPERALKASLQTSINHMAMALYCPPSHIPLHPQATYWLYECLSSFTVHRSPRDLVIRQILIQGVFGGTHDVVFGKLPVIQLWVCGPHLSEQGCRNTSVRHLAVHLDLPLTGIRYLVQVAQSCPTLWDPVDCTVHGILQAGIPEWVAVPFSRGSSQPRD